MKKRQQSTEPKPEVSIETALLGASAKTIQQAMGSIPLVTYGDYGLYPDWKKVQLCIVTHKLPEIQEVAYRYLAQKIGKMTLSTAAKQKKPSPGQTVAMFDLEAYKK